MKTYNFLYKNEEELKKELSKIPKTENNLIQIFSGIVDKEKILKVVSEIKNYYPNANIIGATTDGEIIEGKVTSYQIVISVSIFEKSKVKTLLMEKNHKSFYFGREFAKKILTPSAKLLITFTDGLHMNGEEFLKGIGDVSDIIVAGGMAGDNGEFKETFIFDANNITNKGAVGAIIEGDITINREYGFNWEGIGRKMTITKSIKNRVYTIDNKKAVDVYKYYFGEDDVVKIGVQFPLIIQKGNLKIARAVLGQHDDGSLVFAGNLNEGEKVQFGFGDISNILEKDRFLFEKLEEFDVESIFIYSCMARRRFLGDFVEREIEPFAKIANVSGFFTYGEFFTDKEKIFFNETLTVLILSENERKVKVDYHYKKELSPLKALTHLIRVTSEELNELNEKLEEKVKEKAKEIIEKNKKLEYLYYHDQLTHLPNKYKLDEDIKTYEVFGAILIDIKDFSKMNDIYGDIIGDAILISIANKLKKYSTNDARLYRVGADQFIFVIYRDLNIDRLLQNIQKEMNELVEVKVNNSTIALDVDVVIAVVKGKYKDIKVKADLALNYAKKHRKNLVFYSPELKLEEELKNELQILDMVKDAIREDRVIPVFQKIEKNDGISYECLVRIKKGNELISPGVFLDIIKPTSYYFDITKIVIQKSFETFANRKESISINFLYQDIANEEIVEFLLKKIREYNMQNRVIIEIVESESIEDFETVKNFIERVRRCGIKIALDDFGSGYSNFVYLAKLDPEFIKIDGSIIRNIDKDKNSYIIAKHINEFAKDIGCKTIAEFVANEEIYKKVKELGVDGIQGFFIDEPKVLK